MDLLKTFCTLNHTQIAESNLACSLVLFPLTFKPFMGGRGGRLKIKNPDSKQMELSQITHTGELN